MFSELTDSFCNNGLSSSVLNCLSLSRTASVPDPFVLFIISSPFAASVFNWDKGVPGIPNRTLFLSLQKIIEKKPLVSSDKTYIAFGMKLSCKFLHNSLIFECLEYIFTYTEISLGCLVASM